MDLGTTISRLRAEQHMSQGDLAEALSVSRQSISKWETNASVPELDKLVKLSRLFGVSLDELVTGETPPVPEPPSASAVPSRRFSGRQIAGIVLLCAAFLVWLLLTALGGVLEGLILAVPFLLCAAVCLLCRQRTGLWCTWSIYLCFELDLRWATGINWTLTLRTLTFEPWMNFTRLAIAWVQLLAMLLIFSLTLRSFRKVRIDLKIRKNVVLLAGGWLGLATLRLLKAQLYSLIYQNPTSGTSLGVRLALRAGDILLLALFAVLLTATVCAVRSLRSRAK